MAVEIWPHVALDQVKAAVDAAEKRELDWLVEELHEHLINLKHGLEDCYALLAPIDHGNTLVLSTPRNEIVKGTITRVGTRIVRGTINIRMRTLPQQTLTINPDHPIHLVPLTNLHSLLTQSIDLLNLTLAYAYPSSSSTATPPPPSTAGHRASHLPADLPPPQFLSAQLRVLSQSLSEASAQLRGATTTTASPSTSSADSSWTTRSAAPSHFTPPLSQPHPGSAHPVVSFHLTVQDAQLVLWLRSLEPADAKVNFGTKLALAIGTTRRLEHDESERVFGYCCNHDMSQGGAYALVGARRGSMPASGIGPPVHVPLSGTRTKTVDVYVREKVRVETADPSLMSLSAKLTALANTLALMRRNLAAVLGEEWDGEGDE
ncbi:hypothetical protein VTJ83DRAFT_1499 [Remersonia thermophila]|uniref:Uncharacterized protein n=1 Tax=Remersonia thermophila TaxID=72144 RepID=A0ABR4DG40_9PEZI